MNAYNLADGLEDDLKWLITLNTDLPIRLTDAANMLRQQADRIAELEVYENTIKAWTWDKEKQEYVPPLLKPLSDEEIFEIADSFPFIENGAERCAFARAIEAKVRGEK